MLRFFSLFALADDDGISGSQKWVAVDTLGESSDLMTRKSESRTSLILI